MLNTPFTEAMKPLRRDSVSSIIMDMIIDSLIEKKLRPGDQLPTESDFALRLGVGRNSVREAIKALSSLGVVEIRRGIGTFVPQSISAAMINPLILDLAFEQGTTKELIELRLLLDTGAAELAIRKAPDEDIIELEKVNDRLRNACSADTLDLRKLLNLDLEFHQTLLELSQNRLLSKIGKVIYRLFFASIEKGLQADPNWAVENHQAVIEAIRNRDLSTMQETVRKSLASWIRMLEDQ